MGKRNTNKRQMETFLAAYSTQTAVPTGTLVNATTALNLPDGNIAAISKDLYSTVRANGVFLVAGDTATQVRKIQILQGTPKSAALQTVDGWHAGHKAYVGSQDIERSTVQSFSFTRPNVGTRNTVYVTGFARPEDEQAYGLRTAIRGTRQFRDYGTNENSVYTSYVTPDYTVLGYTDAQAVSALLHNLFYTTNLYSKQYGMGLSQHGNKDFAVLGLDTTGAATGVTIGSVVNGTSIPFLVQNGTTYTIVADHALVQTFGAAIAAGVPTTAVIVPINPTVDHTSADPINAVLFLGLDENRAIAFSDITNVRTTVLVELADSFRNSLQLPTTITQTSRAKEAINTGFNLWVQYRNSAEYGIFNAQNQPHGDFYVQAPIYFSNTESQLYNVYIIDFQNTETTLTTSEPDPQKTVIVLPAGITNGTATAGTILATGFTYSATNTALPPLLEGTIGDWLQTSVTFNSHIFTGAATATTYFGV